jgi:hypothetical protein
MGSDDDDTLQIALHSLQTEAANFGTRWIGDARVRQDYTKAIREFADETLAAVRRGDIAAREGARVANEARNLLMDSARLRLSDLGLARSQALKDTGIALNTLMDKYAQRLFGKSFASLTEAQQGRVALEVIDASGRSRPSVTAGARRLNALGRGLWVFTIGVSVYNVATAENTAHAVVREGVTLGGGWAGGAAGGAVAGLACGPGAPVCVAIGVFVGGALGALGADAGFSWLTRRAESTVDRLRRVRPAYGFPGKSPPVFCFAGDTPVLVPGGARRIDSFVSGDRLLAAGSLGHIPRETQVLSAERHVADVDWVLLRLESGDLLRVTPGHWMLTIDGWKLSEAVRPGHLLATSQAGAVRVAGVVREHAWNAAVYHLNTDFGTYLVSLHGVIVTGRRATNDAVPTRAAKSSA